MTNDLAIVGDIHGDATKLEAAIEFLSGGSVRAVFVGDYINRGPSSRDVVEQLLDFAGARPETVLLRGNHEVALLKLLQEGDRRSFLRHGGLSTVKSYVVKPTSNAIEEFVDSFPEAHRRLIAATELFYEVPGLLVSHVGYDPARPAARDEKAMVTTPHPELLTPEGPMPTKATVFGHYIQGGAVPYQRGTLFGIDTGCGSTEGGRLTVMMYPQLELRQF